MSETTSAPSTSTSSATPPSVPAPAAPLPGQPRDAQGRYQSPAQQPSTEAAPAAAQPRWKVRDQDLSQEEVLALAEKARWDQDHDADSRRELAQARAIQRALQEGRLEDLLGPERMRDAAVNYARRLKEQHEEAQLPPEERERRALKRELDGIRQQQQQREQQARRQEQEQADQQTRQTLVNELKEACGLAGLALTPLNYTLVCDVMRANAASGRNYPPRVVAAQVRQRLEANHSETFKGAKARDYFQRLPGLREALNAMEDEDLLELLAPLGERQRARNAKRLNLQGQQHPPPQATPAPRLEDGREPQTPEDFERLFRENARRR